MKIGGWPCAVGDTASFMPGSPTGASTRSAPACSRRVRSPDCMSRRDGGSRPRPWGARRGGSGDRGRTWQARRGSGPVRRSDRGRVEQRRTGPARRAHPRRVEWVRGTLGARRPARRRPREVSGRGQRVRPPSDPATCGSTAAASTAVASAARRLAVTGPRSSVRDAGRVWLPGPGRGRRGARCGDRHWCGGGVGPPLDPRRCEVGGMGGGTDRVGYRVGVCGGSAGPQGSGHHPGGGLHR